MKGRNERIAMLTAYDAAFARLLDRAGVDVLLVGDSLGMVMLGYETTVPVTLDMILHHSQAVTRAAKRALVVADMPFLTYQINVEEALRNAGRIIQEGGAEAVKIEGGRSLKDLVARLVDVGIPVMGHLGLTPQSVHQLGGFRIQARDPEGVEQLMEDARALEQAGACGIVLECIPETAAAAVSRELNIPTIGIGAGPYCDGQVLVLHDMLGLLDTVPSFVKKYANLSEIVSTAAASYIRDVREGRYPLSRSARKINS
jgi:3-methyl-2-oxobutanoate hydroxymethyltransferase